jgi:hypothetical protein
MALAFLVDGHSEKRFLQKICPGKTIQRLNLNGNTVTCVAIAKRAASQIRLWGGKYYPIIILVDLEDRDMPFGEFGESIEAALRAEGVQDQIIVGVADRMLENWMLADPDVVEWNARPESVDGIHGAGMLKKIFGQYDKASDGPDVLVKCRPSSMRKNSASFCNFLSKLAKVRCHWLGK